MKALGVAVAATLLGLSVASCGMMGDRSSSGRTGASTGSSSDCAGLTGSARERCLSQQSGRSGSGSGSSSGAGSTTGSGAASGTGSTGSGGASSSGGGTSR